MGYGREARRVRDLSLPARYRLHALGSCIQLAQPIGFNATWSYLQAKVRRDWRDPDFLLPGLEGLEAERAIYLATEAEYAQLRREQKAVGCRYPRQGEVTPRTPTRWHGDERFGALHALEFWRRSRSGQPIAEHPKGKIVLGAVDNSLASAAAHDLDLAELQRILEWARRQIHVIGWERDRSEYGTAYVINHLLGQLHLMANGASPIATLWNFDKQP